MNMTDIPEGLGIPADAKMEDFKPSPAPVFHASAIMVQGTGNDFFVSFQKGIPAVYKGAPTAAIIGEPAAIIALSPSTAKDLLLALQEQVELHEKQYGEIRTPFMQRPKQTKQ